MMRKSCILWRLGTECEKYEVRITSAETVWLFKIVNFSVLFQARVMRDMKNVDAQGIGKSKEFGFVSFTTHEHALQALRNINNNPNIFTSARVSVIVRRFPQSPFLKVFFQNCSKRVVCKKNHECLSFLARLNSQ
jgi:hypothetical protein